MRIAFLTTEFPRPGLPHGGLGNYLSKITTLLLQKGHEPVVFFSGDVERKYDSDGVCVCEIPRSTKAPFWMISRLGAFRKYVVQAISAKHIQARFKAVHREKAFDIVQSASFCSPGHALVRNSPIPVVVRASSLTSCLRSAQGRKIRLDDHIMDWAEIRQMILADGVFAPSEFLAKIIGQVTGLSCEVIRTPFWLPKVDEDGSLWSDRLKSKKYVLYFGRMDSVKGVDLLADALPRILDDHPDLHFVFAGPNSSVKGGKDCREYIKWRVGERMRRVELFDSLEKSQLFPVIRNSLFVVLPSRVDNFPNTCLEAQALGKLVVGSRESSLDEMIEPGLTGFLADNGSKESLEDALSEALALPEGRKVEMEGLVRELVERRNPDNDVDNLLAFYTRTINRAR